MSDQIAIRTADLDHNRQAFIAGAVWGLSDNDSFHIVTHCNCADAITIATATGGQILPPLDGVRGRACWQVRLPLIDLQRPTLGELAYIEDCTRLPVHHDGTARPKWAQLESYIHANWNRYSSGRAHPRCRLDYAGTRQKIADVPQPARRRMRFALVISGKGAAAPAPRCDATRSQSLQGCYDAESGIAWTPEPAALIDALPACLRRYARRNYSSLRPWCEAGWKYESGRGVGTGYIALHSAAGARVATVYLVPVLEGEAA